MRVLLAEDDDDTARPVDQGLFELGHQVVRVATGDAALKLGGGEPFDVAVIDRMLPELDGTEVVQRWRAAGVSTPVLMLTALGGRPGRDRIAGFIYIGEKIKQPVERTRPDPDKVITYL